MLEKLVIVIKLLPWPFDGRAELYFFLRLPFSLPKHAFMCAKIAFVCSTLIDLPCLFHSSCNSRFVKVKLIFHFGIGTMAICLCYLFIPFHSMIRALAIPLVVSVPVIKRRLDFNVFMMCTVNWIFNWLSSHLATIISGRAAIKAGVGNYIITWNLWELVEKSKIAHAK